MPVDREFAVSVKRATASLGALVQRDRERRKAPGGVRALSQHLGQKRSATMESAARTTKMVDSQIIAAAPPASSGS